MVWSFYYHKIDGAKFAFFCKDFYIMLPNLRTRFLSRECCVIFIQKISKYRELCRQDIQYCIFCWLVTTSLLRFYLVLFAWCLAYFYFAMVGVAKICLPMVGVHRGLSGFTLRWSLSGSTLRWSVSVRIYLVMVGVVRHLHCNS